jgi:hypothetical protein
MNWEAIGSIAELVGGLGVVASLLYLGVQIRQNTRSLRAATYESLAGATSTSNSTRTLCALFGSVSAGRSASLKTTTPDSTPTSA